MLAQQEQIKVDKTHWRFHRLNMLIHGVNYTFTLNLPIDTLLTCTSKWGGVKQITLFFYKLGTKIKSLFELCPVFRDKYLTFQLCMHSTRVFCLQQPTQNMYAENLREPQSATCRLCILPDISTYSIVHLPY